MSSDKMDEQEPNLFMDEWQDAALDVASDTNNHNSNENNIENAGDHDDAFPTDIVDASGSNEMSEGSGTSSGMGSFVDVNSPGNDEDDNDDDDLSKVLNEEGSQNTDPSLVLVDKVEEDVLSLNDEIVVQDKEETKDSGEEQAISGDTVPENEQVFSTPIRSNKVNESRNLDNYLEGSKSSMETKDEVVDDDKTKDTPLLEEENTQSPCEPNGDEMGRQLEEKIESQTDHSSYMTGKSPRSQNYRMKHIKLRQKYVSSSKSGMDNSNDNGSLFQSPSNLTSASQVTTVHRNTAIPSVNSNISERSDISSFGKEDIGSSPTSEMFLKDWERRRLRQIALEAVAGSTAVSDSSEATETPKEDRPSESGLQAEFDPYAVNGQSSSSAPDPGINETVPSSTSKDYFADPRQLRKGNIINTESNTSSNTCASNHTFENILPVRSEHGGYIDIGRLIVVGVAGIIGGVIQSVFALTTCQFVNIHKKVGYYDEVLVVHAGMSSFTPMDSVFQGHSHCISYNHQYYGQQAPVFAKANATLALICGGVSILILWLYNLTTKTTFVLWNVGKGFAVAAAFFQLLTLQFFFSSVCEDETCRIGTGSAASLVAACIYLLMAFEMNRNCPARRLIPGLVSALVEKKAGQSNTKDKTAVHESDSFYSAPNLV